MFGQSQAGQAAPPGRCVIVPSSQLGQACIHIAANLQHFDIAAPVSQLRGAS